jgi:hypothetical protein
MLTHFAVDFMPKKPQPHRISSVLPKKVVQAQKKAVPFETALLYFRKRFIFL